MADAATIAVNHAAGCNKYVTLGGNRVIGAPSAGKPGWPLNIAINTNGFTPVVGQRLQVRDGWRALPADYRVASTDVPPVVGPELLHFPRFPRRVGLVMLIRTDTLKPWRGEPLNDITHPLNIEDVWTDGELAAVGLVKAKPFVVPDGKQIVAGSEPTYAEDGAETYPVEDTPGRPADRPQGHGARPHHRRRQDG